MLSINSIVNSDLKPYENQYEYIQYCMPNRACKRGFHGCRWCNSEYCCQHGWDNRNEGRNWVIANIMPTEETYRITLNFDQLQDAKSVSAARKVFFKTLNEMGWEYHYVWRLHFLNFVPHFDMTIISNTIRFFPFVKTAWVTALKSIENPSPTTARVYCKPVETWEASIAYIFQTDIPILEAYECPPRIKGQRWHYWDTKS